jgi:hypothetical protein
MRAAPKNHLEARERGVLGPIMASDSGSRESVASERQFRIFPVSDKSDYCEFMVGEMEKERLRRAGLSSTPANPIRAAQGAGD